MANLDEAARPPRRLFPPRYLYRIWRGEVPLAHLFFVDMLLWGTLLNLFATGVALVLSASGAPAAISIAAFLTPLPYNIFLFFAVSRTAAREPGRLARSAGLLAGIWAAVITFV